jgi:DNA-binding transcriptional LysR family regulator
MLDLRRLSTFREVVRRRSFSAAAEALDYTQSSVSQQIATLERELGATLIDRGGRPLTPTPVGQSLLRHAHALLDQAAAIEHEIAALARGETGLVRVGGFYTAWATFMPQAVAEISRSRPGVQLELSQLEPEPALRGIRIGDLDVAVVYRFTDPGDDDRLAWTHLLDDPYAIALPAAHPLETREEVALEDLARERWVSPPRDQPYTQLLMSLCREHGGFEPDVAYESGDIAMAQPLVAAGLAVALLPALGLVPRHAGVIVRPVVGTPPARSVWVVTRARERAQAAETMVEALLRAGRAARD